MQGPKENPGSTDNPKKADGKKGRRDSGDPGGEESPATHFQLFWTFFKLGIMTIGGGMAMIPLMQGIIVDKHRWMSEEEVVDCIAVSQSLPGIIALNMATYIGNAKRGITGAAAATFGMILPSLIVIIAIVEILHGIGDNPYVNGALTGIKAAATGLIAFSVYKVGRKIIHTPLDWILAIAALTAVVGLQINAVWTIIGGIICGLILMWRKGGDRS